MKNYGISGSSNLRLKAEELLKSKSSNYPFKSEIDTVKLLHELEVGEIELQLQNEELRIANDFVKENSEKFTSLFELAPTGYFIISRSGEIIDANLSGRIMVRKVHENIYGHRLGLYLSDDTKQIFNQFLSRTFESKRRETCNATILIDGNPAIHVYITGQLFEKEDNCLVNITDISEVVHAQSLQKEMMKKLSDSNLELEQLLKLNAEKDIFISILAHDLRSPFNVLFGISELLQESIHSGENSDAEKYISLLHTSIEDTYVLLEDLLIWSKVRMGKFPFNPQKFNFIKVCEEVIQIIKPAANTKNININFFIVNEITTAADINMLKAILRNLLSNAVKFTKQNGIVSISATQEKSQLIISVTDNGIGIKSEHLERLFDISQHSSTIGTANEEGNGLGLLLCTEFIEKHGGKIWAESEIGKGSTFYFTIPQSVQ